MYLCPSSRESDSILCMCVYMYEVVSPKSSIGQHIVTTKNLIVRKITDLKLSMYG